MSPVVSVDEAKAKPHGPVHRADYSEKGTCHSFRIMDTVSDGVI